MYNYVDIIYAKIFYFEDLNILKLHQRTMRYLL